MSIILRQSTAVDVMAGPFVDETDGSTPETGITMGASNIRLSKNAANFSGKSDSTAGVHVENGFYRIEFNATDTNTVGSLVMFIQTFENLPVFHEYQVVEEAVYDLLYASGATGQVTLTSATIQSVLSVLKGQDRRGTAQSGGNNTMVLAAGDQEANDFYNDAMVILLEGTGTAGLTVPERTRQITDYVNSTNQITVDANWNINPSNGTTYLIVGG